MVRYGWECPWPWWRIGLWTVLAGVLLWRQGPSFVRCFRPGHGQVTDFCQDWLSARNWLCGLPVYTDHARSLPRHLGPTVTDKELVVSYNAHPPGSVLFVLPFARLDYADAQLAWNLAMLPALVVSLLLLGVRLRWGGACGLALPAKPQAARPGLWDGLPGLTFAPWALLPATALLVICGPLRSQLLHGQWNLLLLLCLMACWGLERSGRPGWAGAVLGVATAIKLFPAFLFLYFLLRRQWRALAAGTLSFAVLNALAFLVLGSLSFATYLAVVLPSLRQYGASWINNAPRGFWVRLFNPTATANVLPLVRAPWLAMLATWLGDLLVVGLTVWVILRARTRGEHDRAFALTVAAMLLVAPLVWDYYFLLLLLPAAWLWLQVPPKGPRRWAFRVMVFLLWLPPVWFHSWLLRIPMTPEVHPPPATPWQSLAVLALPCYALVGLFVLLAVTGPTSPPSWPARTRHFIQPEYAE